MKAFLYLLCISAFISGCDGSKLSPTPDNQFIGTWQLEGRSMLDSIQIIIQRNEEGELQGRIYKLNSNKYVQLFVDSNSVFVSKIVRNSNFEFALTEKKVANELLSTYDLSGSSELKAEFISKDLIGLTTGNAKPKDSKVRYKRVK